MAGIARLFTTSVTVEPYLGVGTSGAKYSAPLTRLAFVNDSRKLVRDTNGQEVVSETTLYTFLADIGSYPVKSRVTVNGRAAFVIDAHRRDSAGPASAHHAHIVLT